MEWKPRCTAGGQTPGTPKTLINQELWTAGARVPAIFMAAEASLIVFPLRHGRGSSSSFLITPHKTKSCPDSSECESYVLFFFFSQSIIISIVVILQNSTSDLLQLWSLPFSSVPTSVIILSKGQTIFLPCYLSHAVVLLCSDDMASSWAVILVCIVHLILLPSPRQTLRNSGGVHIQRWDR